MKLTRHKRQYLISSIPIEKLSSWTHFTFNEYHIYVEKSLEFKNSENKEIKATLLGYWINPEEPQLSNQEILDNLIESCHSLQELFEFVYNLSGRFVLIYGLNNETFILNDASGFRCVFYSKIKNNKYFTSSISLLKTIENIKEKNSLNKYYKSDHYLHTPTYMWHAGYTFFEGVEHLVPNHYLNVKQLSQIRFYPNRKNTIVTEADEIEKIENEIIKLLKNSIQSIHDRGPIALALSAGNDSRVLISLMKSISKNILFWISYRSIKEADFYVPKKILEYYNLKFLPIKNIKPDKKFKNFYFTNTVMAHKIWCEFNYSKLNKFPEDHVVVRGAAAESARNYYYPNYSSVHPKKISLDYLCTIPNLSFLRIPELQLDFKTWLNGMSKIEKSFNYKTLDFIFWEHREGSWQAQNQLESDYHFEVFVPYNNRKILDLMLKLPNNLRDKKDPEIYKNIITKNWADLHKFPINPKDKFSKFELSLKYYKGALKYKINKLWNRIN